MVFFGRFFGLIRSIKFELNQKSKFYYEIQDRRKIT